MVHVLGPDKLSLSAWSALHWDYMAVVLMLRCSKCPGFCGAGFCGMVRLGPRTCGVKIGGNWIYYWLYQLDLWMSSRSPGFSWRLLRRRAVVFRRRFPGGLMNKRIARFPSYPRWESLCDRSVHEVTCCFILTCQSCQQGLDRLRRPPKSLSRMAHGVKFSAT